MKIEFVVHSVEVARVEERVNGKIVDADGRRTEVVLRPADPYAENTEVWLVPLQVLPPAPPPCVRLAYAGDPKHKVGQVVAWEIA